MRLDIFSCVVRSTFCTASLIAAAIRSSSMSLSSALMMEGSRLTRRTSCLPVMTIFAMPPPASPVTSMLAISACARCIFACSCCACFIMLPILPFIEAPRDSDDDGDGCDDGNEDGEPSRQSRRGRHHYHHRCHCHHSVGLMESGCTVPPKTSRMARMLASVSIERRAFCRRSSAAAFC